MLARRFVVPRPVLQQPTYAIEIHLHAQQHQGMLLYPLSNQLERKTVSSSVHMRPIRHTVRTSLLSKVRVNQFVQDHTYADRRKPNLVLDAGPMSGLHQYLRSMLRYEHAQVPGLVGEVLHVPFEARDGAPVTEEDGDEEA